MVFKGKPKRKPNPVLRGSKSEKMGLSQIGILKIRGFPLVLLQNPQKGETKRRAQICAEGKPRGPKTAARSRRWSSCRCERNRLSISCCLYIYTRIDILYACVYIYIYTNTYMYVCMYTCERVVCIHNVIMRLCFLRVAVAVMSSDKV